MNEPMTRLSEKKRLMIVAAATLGILAIVNAQIAIKEGIIEDGRIVLLRLAPRDPRSLMQGDYMALRYAMADPVARAAEVEAALQEPGYAKLLGKMYGNTPAAWSGRLTGFKRLRFIINCLTRMRMLTESLRLNMSHSGAPWRARRHLVSWFDFPEPAWAGTRIVFGHWSQLGLMVLPELISLDTGCVWGRQLTAVRLDKTVPRVYQVNGQD